MRKAFLSAAMWFTLAVVLAAAAAAAQDTSLPSLPARTDYALVIVVSSPRPGPARVGITFARAVDHAELTQRIERLAARTHWSAWEVRLKDAPGADGGIQTSASFFCEGIVDRARGLLGVEPLVEEFSREGRFRAAFIVPGLKPFAGPVGFEKNGLQVRFSLRKEVYEYDVKPPAGAGASPAKPPSSGAAASRGGNRLWTATLIIVGAALAVVAGRLLYGRKQKRPAISKRPAGETGNGD